MKYDPKAALDTHMQDECSWWTCLPCALPIPPLNVLSEDEILESVCEYAQELRQVNNGIPPTLVGEWSLSTGITANSSSNTENDQAKRTWFRRLFEAQNAAFTTNGPGQPSIGLYFWSWKTEYDIDAWSYRKGIADGYIPSNVGDPSSYIFPILPNGCIDATFPYQAAAVVTPAPSSSYASPIGRPSTTPNKKSSASIVSSNGVCGIMALAVTVALFGLS